MDQAVESAPPDPITLPASGPLTVALTGDALIVQPVNDKRDPATDAAFELLRRSHLAFANLELTFRGGVSPPRLSEQAPPAWPSAPPDTARELRRLGFDLISLANNHAYDYGAEGVTSTTQALDAAGIVHAGAGQNLDEARKAAYAGAGERRVALLAVTTSSNPESRATYARPDITPRAGTNPLRYAADVTADATTFNTLRESAGALNAGPPGTDSELTFFGTTIRKGPRTEIDFVVAGNEQNDILDRIRGARRDGALVIVSLHSHEPTNTAEQPAEFVERFARAAVDAGAHVVVGHGPHRLRGIEIHEGGVIFYSLGNFVYQADAVDFRAADMFDAGTDLYAFMLGAAKPDAADARVPQDPAWWESVIVEAVFDGGRPAAINLHPIVLDRPGGTPAKAPPDRAAAILERLTRLSAPYKTTIRTVEGVAELVLPR